MTKKRKIVKNSLGFDSGLYLYQDKRMFNYSVDTILLGNFATINSKVKRVLEVGTNNGALSIFLAGRSKSITIDAIEILKEPLKLAKRNFKLNKCEKRINLIHGDFRKFATKKKLNENEKYDLIISNPPFYKVDSFKKPKNLSPLKLKAIFEYNLTLEELISNSQQVIKQKGFLAFVLPIERFVDACVLLRKYNFEPKRVQMVHPRINKKAILVLIESRFKTGWGTFFLPNLYLHTENKDKHEYKKEIKKMYKPIKKDF